MTLTEIHVIYGLAWLSFGAGHSFLASQKAKSLLEPKLGAYYRITYNGFASLHIFAVWVLGRWLFDGVDAFAVSETVGFWMSGASLLGVLILICALMEYDLGLLAGTAQIRNFKKGVPEPAQEPLHTGGLHRYVRHPIYLGAYLILLGSAQDDRAIATAIWGSAYLFIGTGFEERHLITLYGDAYRSYRAKVPSILPWRGKAL
ncbi:MAG: isoprenylcysteine carboxylmethyltransferase family protein [Rhodospirillales bacterium]|nr:isoprenylcysteine carboxylmethyltransferase family protein [Rhodospirillales bacterium]